MTTIDKIRAEIERRYEENREKARYDDYYRGMNDGLDLFESFLDTLEAETSYDTQKYTPSPFVDIGDVARVQFASHAKVFDKKRKAVFDWEQFKEVVGIFYGFDKKDPSDTLESEKPNDLEEPISEDLEKEIDKFYGVVRKNGKTYDENNGELCFDPKDDETYEHELRLARHFYELGKNAK